eukprot:CCRYP_016864-RB/>CCRYP_016864-RB protein AED:0.06 eAED:0.06 QI:210/1/1/1/0.5/0.33/3/704/250
MPCRYLATIACLSSCVVQNAMALGHRDLMILRRNRHATLSFQLRGNTRSNANLRGATGKSRRTHSKIPISFLHTPHSCPRRKTCQSSRSRTDAASSNNETPQIKTLLPKTASDNPFYIEEEIIKKSRFIGIATSCATWEEAQLHLDRVRKDHPKSRHVCFGFVSGGGGTDHGGVGTERCSDDGEPTGTAGVPILGAIKGEGLSDTLCIVVRYFGTSMIALQSSRKKSLPHLCLMTCIWYYTFDELQTNYN